MSKAICFKEFGGPEVLRWMDVDVPEPPDREVTNGEGVPVVYDSVGKDTFEASLKCLRPCGLLASFGNASGGSQHPALKNDWMLRASRRCS